MLTHHKVWVLEVAMNLKGGQSIIQDEEVSKPFALAEGIRIFVADS